MNEDRYLAHYGILGMKWGRRRPTGPDGRIIKNSKKVTPNKYKELKEHNKSIKDNWKSIQADIKTGKLSKESSTYKEAKTARTTQILERLYLTKGERADTLRYSKQGLDKGKALAKAMSNQVVKDLVTEAAVVTGTIIVLGLLGRSQT